MLLFNGVYSPAKRLIYLFNNFLLNSLHANIIYLFVIRGMLRGRRGWDCNKDIEECVASCENFGETLSD